jgi:hypothetical protein
MKNKSRVSISAHVKKLIRPFTYKKKGRTVRVSRHKRTYAKKQSGKSVWDWVLGEKPEPTKKELQSRVEKDIVVQKEVVKVEQPTAQPEQMQQKTSWADLEPLSSEVMDLQRKSFDRGLTEYEQGRLDTLNKVFNRRRRQ